MRAVGSELYAQGLDAIARVCDAPVIDVETGPQGDALTLHYLRHLHHLRFTRAEAEHSGGGGV